MNYVDQELSVEDMLADPIVQTLMRYDGISASDVRHTMEQVNLNRPDMPAGAHKKSVDGTSKRWGTPRPINGGARHKAA
tara:strand:+ start:546 stop:782 length:237 start_codon:yes stop_codon:yes gene_type:complete